MTPRMYRQIVPPAAALPPPAPQIEPVLIVSSDNYRRRVSIMYRRLQVTTEEQLILTPELFIFTKNSVDPRVAGTGIFVLPGIQFQIELERKDFIYAIASSLSSELDTNGIEVAIVIEPLEGYESGESTKPLAAG